MGRETNMPNRVRRISTKFIFNEKLLYECHHKIHREDSAY